MSGAFIEAFFEVDNDFEVNVIIGAAGKGGAGRNSGSEGGTTYFGSLITAPGGTGGGAGEHLQTHHIFRVFHGVPVRHRPVLY
ncbi:hypothetical protein OHD37_24965 [Escherichia coli]|nr:hypothetical protein [Escherichia coli]